MKAGDIINIYVDSIECTQLEGKAELIALVNKIDDTFQTWMVEFEDHKGYVYQRIIKTQCNEQQRNRNYKNIISLL